jgi:diguanylate cyclase
MAHCAGLWAAAGHHFRRRGKIVISLRGDAAMTQLDSDRTIALAQQALSQIKALQLSAEPQNYEIWYTYVAGTRPKLNAHINDILAQRQTLSPADLDQIYYQFFSSARAAERVETVGAKMKDEVDQIVAMIEAAIGATSQYQTELEDNSRKLALPIDRDTLRVIVESLVFSTKEVERENSTLSASLGVSRKQIEHLQEDLVSIRAESLSDPLTMLSNRKHFDQSLERIIAKSGQSGEIFCLILADVDHFKTFNDTHGHQMGDHVLRLIAAEMKQAVKGQDVVARYGGEEFAIILPATGLIAAAGAAERIRQATMSKELRRRKTGESLGRVTVSLGVAEYRRHESAQDLVERADNCLYAAKRRGRNCVIAQDQLAVGSPQAV